MSHFVKLFRWEIFLKPFQLNLFPVKHRVCEIINPISHDGGQGMVTCFVLHWLVLMTKNEEVDARVKGSLLLGILVKAGVRDVVVIAALHLVLELFQTVFVRPT